MRKGSVLAWLACVVVLSGCAVAPRGKEPISAWVQAVPGGGMQARAVVAAGDACPVVALHGRAVATTLRAGAAAAPGGALFDVNVCEAMVPAPSVAPKRIVVLGDTGCRASAPQVCDDSHWPFASVARAAAAMRPDLVVHVGDYHYRECAPGTVCDFTPQGYGWDVWKADFFAPAAPLLAAAPWVFARGNHEECKRAGQGWHRLLAPGPYDAAKNCDDKQLQGAGDFTAPYAVPIGAGLQLVVFDSGAAGDSGPPTDPRVLDEYVAQARAASALAMRMPTWFVSHHPVLGFAPNWRDPANPFPGNKALQAVLKVANGPAYYPAPVQLALHGHVHLFEALTFTSGHPPAIVAGHGGVATDSDLPEPSSQWPPAADGVTLGPVKHERAFGFLLLEQRAAEAWTLTAFHVDGRVMNTCELGPGRALACR